MKSLLLIVTAMLILAQTPETLSAVKTRVYSCDGLGNVVATWEPAGAPANGDDIKVKNLTVDVIRHVAYNGTEQVATLPLGVTTGVLGQYAPGHFIDFCARCTGSFDRAGEPGCVDDNNLTLTNPTLPISAGCAECADYDIPTLSEWAMIIFGVLLLGLLTYYVVKRRRPAASQAAI